MKFFAFFFRNPVFFDRKFFGFLPSRFSRGCLFLSRHFFSNCFFSCFFPRFSIAFSFLFTGFPVSSSFVV